MEGDGFSHEFIFCRVSSSSFSSHTRNFHLCLSSRRQRFSKTLWLLLPRSAQSHQCTQLSPGRPAEPTRWALHLGFVCWILCDGFCTPGFTHRVLHARFCMPGFTHQVLQTGLRTLGFSHWILHAGFCALSSARRVLHTGICTLAFARQVLLPDNQGGVRATRPARAHRSYSATR